MGIFNTPSQMGIKTDADILREIGLDDSQVTMVIDMINENVQEAINGDAGEREADCEHTSLRAEVMCQIMRNHAQIASAEGYNADRSFNSEAIVGDFHRIWEAIEG